MAHAEVAGERIAVHTDYREKELIRSVPGALWDPQSKSWHVPLAWGACKALRGVFGDTLVLGPELNQWAWTERQRRIEPSVALRNLVEYPDHDPGDLYPFQVPGVEFICTAEQLLLGDDMGSGKSIQIARAARRLVEQGKNPFPVAIFCPNSTKKQWAAFWRRWFGEVHCFSIGGGKQAKAKQFAAAADLIDRGEKVVVIMNWEAARLHSRLAPYGSVRLKKCPEHGGQDPKVKASTCEVHHKELNDLPFRTVVADEAHRMKDPKSKQTRAVWAVQHGPSVYYRWATTGTPIANHPGDLWGIMHGLAPEEYPTKTKFIDRYCLQSWNAFGGMDIIGLRPDTKEEFFSFFDPRFRRMPKEVVLPFLPQKVRTIRNPEMPPKLAKAYREMAEGMVTRLDDGSIVLATNNLAKNTRLTQFSSAYATVLEDGSVRLADPSHKLDELMEVLDELGDKPVVVVAEHRQLIELACERLDKSGITWRRIVGGMTEDQRDSAKKDFQDGHARVFLFTIKAGGTGLDGLQDRADTMIFLQRSWSMLENKQAEDRVHRIGSEKHESVHYIDFVTPDTIEEVQIERLYAKAERLEEINRDRARRMAAGLSTEELDLEEYTILSTDLTEAA